VTCIYSGKSLYIVFTELFCFRYLNSLNLLYGLEMRLQISGTLYKIKCTGKDMYVTCIEN
jgi:hypothetical protein